MNNDYPNNNKITHIEVSMPKKNEFMISHFVGITIITSLLFIPLSFAVAFFMKVPVKIHTVLAVTLLLTVVFALTAFIVGFILKRFNFRLNSVFKYLVLFIVSTVSAFITIVVLELPFVTYTLTVLLGLLVVSIGAGIILTISGKFAIPKE